jgi:murein DD-endopeptidase MepM/ murein hydrolase activator NlpD
MAAKLFDTDNVNIGGDPAAHRSRPKYKPGDWYSGKGYDLHVKPGTMVYSLTDGKVVANNLDPDDCAKGVYGNRVTILTDQNDELYYTHIECRLNVGQIIKKGDPIGKVRSGCGVGPHLHIASRKNDVKDYVDFKTWAIVGGAAATTTTTDLGGETEDNDPNDTKSKDSNVIAAIMRDTLQPIYSKFAVGTGLIGLGKESSENQKLIEQIQRIKNLM